MRTDTAQVFNYGGGRQTAALVVLVAAGRLPRPSRIIMADTGREARSTFAYLDAHMRPLLRSIGMDVEIAGHDLATVDLYATDGKTLLPVFTATGKMLTYCSNEWKARVVQRYLRQRDVTSATSWIGFSLDERKRVKPDPPGPWQRRYPLIELMLTRYDCERIVQDVGLPLPPKSACYMCPHRSNEEWRQIRDDFPDQWAAAIEIDEELRAADGRDGGLYLHQSRVPLAEATLDAPDRRDAPRQCGLGLCFV